MSHSPLHYPGCCPCGARLGWVIVDSRPYELGLVRLATSRSAGLGGGSTFGVLVVLGFRSCRVLRVYANCEGIGMACASPFGRKQLLG